MKGWDRLLVAAAAAVAVATTGATLHARATMASVESDVAVLKAQRMEDVKKMDEMRADIKELLRRVK